MPDDPTTDYNAEAEFNAAINSSVDEPSNEELARQIQELYQQRADDRANESSSPPAEPASEGEPTPSAPVPPPSGDEVEPTPPAELPAPESYDFGNGLVLDRETAQTYAEFHQFLQDNPDFAEITQAAWQEARSQTAPGPPEVVIPEELDLDDPNVKFLWEQLQSTRSDLTSALERIQQHDTAITTQTSATTEALVNRAVVSFKQQHKLSDDEMQTIRETAARLEVLPALMSAVDPITNRPRKVDPLAAIETALETAYWNIPTFREREIEVRLATKAEDDKRKRALTSLGGSSGSVPRTPPKPQTKQEIQQAMVNDLTTMIFGPSQSNEE